MCDPSVNIFDIFHTSFDSIQFAISSLVRVRSIRGVTDERRTL